MGNAECNVEVNAVAARGGRQQSGRPQGCEARFRRRQALRRVRILGMLERPPASVSPIGQQAYDMTVIVI